MTTDVSTDTALAACRGVAVAYGSGETAVRELGVRLVVGGEGERFDADALGTGLFLRTWENGDRFQPLGMTGEKKLQDFFVDRKIARRRRDAVPLVVDESDRIVWVAGHEIDERFRVTDPAQAVVILRLKLLGGLA